MRVRCARASVLVLAALTAFGLLAGNNVQTSASSQRLGNGPCDGRGRACRDKSHDKNSNKCRGQAGPC